MRCSCAGCGQVFEAAPQAGHRLMCGDSTSAADVATLTEGGVADLCFTSPPYGQQRDYTASIGDWDKLMQGVFAVLPMAPAGQVLVNLGLIHRDNEWQPYWAGWVEWMRQQGWRRFGWYVWDQGPGMPGDWNGRLAPSFEFVFHFNRYAVKARKTKDKLPDSIEINDYGGGMRGKSGKVGARANPAASLQPKKIPDNVLRVMRHKARGNMNSSHPAMFPVALATEIIEAFSDPGDVVFEPFGGSGTQIISAEQNARTCWAMEIAPSYVDVAVRRYQAFSGKPAVLARDGRTFDQIAVDRRKA